MLYHKQTTGDKGENFYFILRGRVSVNMEFPKRVVAELGEGTGFGEIALMNDKAGHFLVSTCRAQYRKI